MVRWYVQTMDTDPPDFFKICVVELTENAGQSEDFSEFLTAADKVTEELLIPGPDENDLNIEELGSGAIWLEWDSYQMMFTDELHHLKAGEPDLTGNQIVQFTHCQRCVREIMDGKAGTNSPTEYADYEIGFTVPGLQLWCKRHNCNIFHIDFEGVKHPAHVGEE